MEMETYWRGRITLPIQRSTHSGALPGQYKIKWRGTPPPLPYPVPLVRKGFSLIRSAVPVAWWRSVENSFHGFAVESFIDELAHAAGQDPYLFRKRLLQLPQVPNSQTDGEGGTPPDPKRLLAVLDLVAQKGRWGKPLARAEVEVLHAPPPMLI